jgi:putative FmdB family regulatory protein
MPTYEFKCLQCGCYFTKQLSMSRRKEAVCEKCGSSRVEQVFHCCNVMGKKGSGGEEAPAGGSACSHKGGCGGCSGCS